MGAVNKEAAEDEQAVLVHIKISQTLPPKSWGHADVQRFYLQLLMRRESSGFTRRLLTYIEYSRLSWSSAAAPSFLPRSQGLELKTAADTDHRLPRSVRENTLEDVASFFRGKQLIKGLGARMRMGGPLGRFKWRCIVNIFLNWLHEPPQA